MGHYSSLNKGGASIIKSVLKTFTEVIPKAELTILSVYPKLDSARYGIKVLKDIRATKTSRWPLLFAWVLFYKIFKIKVNMLVETDIRETLTKCAEADVIVVGGGDILSSLYDRSYLSLFYSICLAKLLRKPVIIYAHTIGPFGSIWSKMLASRIFNLVDLILVRDEISKAYLVNMGVSRPCIYLTADPAFLLEPVSYERVRKIFSRENIDPGDRPLIGVVISSTIYRYGFPELRSQEKKWKRYVEIMTKVVNYLTEELNGVVILIPHVFGPKKTQDDRTINEFIHRKVKSNLKVKLVKNEYTPEELKSVIGQCDLFVSTRMHPLIHAVSINVPSIGIEYNHKIKALMDMLGQEKYVSSIKTLDFNELKTKISAMYLARHIIREELNSKVRIIKKRSKLNARLVKGLLKQKGIL